MLPAVEMDGSAQDRVKLLRRWEIVYVFLGSRRVINLISGLRDRALPFRHDRVYVCARGKIFGTCFRTVRELVDHLSDPDLLQANQGVFAHLEYSSELDIPGRLLGVVIGQRSGGPMLEYITLSRRGLTGFRRRLLLPRRTTASRSGTDFR